MTPGKTTILVPIVAPYLNMNDRLNRWEAQRRKVQWRDATMWSVAQQLGPPRNRRRPPSLVEFVFPVKGKRRRDPHNLYPTIKVLVDSLVCSGVWPDDTPEWVATREPVLSTTVKQIIITLTPREES